MICFKRSMGIDNSLYVSGPTLDVKKFIETSKGIPWQTTHAKQDEGTQTNTKPLFCFNALVPMPKEIYDHLKEPVEEGANISVGEAWMLRNWGTCPDIHGDDVITNLDSTNEEARFFISF